MRAASSVVLHEMVAGRRTFDPATPVETMAAILGDEPAALKGRLYPTEVELTASLLTLYLELRRNFA